MACASQVCQAPISGRNCVYYEVVVEEWHRRHHDHHHHHGFNNGFDNGHYGHHHHHHNAGYWSEVLREEMCVDYQLTDDNGAAVTIAGSKGGVKCFFA